MPPEPKVGAIKVCDVLGTKKRPIKRTIFVARIMAVTHWQIFSTLPDLDPTYCEMCCPAIPILFAVKGGGKLCHAGGMVILGFGVA